MRIQITVDGQTFPIARDVATTHPQAVHDAMGTQSESELQYCLDQLYVGDWYDANGNHRGPDSNGLEMFREYRLISAKGTREVTGSIWQAVQSAMKMDAELQPAYGVTVEDDSGSTVAEIRDGAVVDGLEVEGGEGEDHDTGRVERIDSTDMAFVTWDSGVKTHCPIADLRLA